MSRESATVTKRVTRALDNFFHVEAESEPGEYRVHSESGSTYTVTLPDGTCTCPDGQRGPWCKHAYRALFVTGHAPKIEGFLPTPTPTRIRAKSPVTSNRLTPRTANQAICLPSVSIGSRRTIPVPPLSR